MPDANQTVLWRYQTPLLGSDLAQVNANVLYPGIYLGLGVAWTSGAQVSIGAGSMLIYDSASYATQALRKMVKIAFEADFTFTCDTTTHPRFIVARFTWVDALDNVASIVNTDTVQPYDVILAAIEWNGNVVSSVDTSSSTQGFTSQFDLIVNNLRPVADVTTPRRMTIAPGRFVYGRSSVSFAGTTVTHDVASADARYDVVGIDDAGAVQVIKGIEGEAQPTFSSFLPIYVVRVRVGVGAFLMTDVLDVRPFLTFSGVMGDDNVVLDLTGLGSLSGAGVTDTLASLVTWLNSALFSGSVVNAEKLSGATRATAVVDNDITVPTGAAVKAYADAAIAEAVATGILNIVRDNSVPYALLLNKVSHLLSKDVGMVGWFPFDPGTGWLRANGSVIDSAVNPEYETLVTKLKAESGADASSQFYNVSATKAKLPNLVNRYVKDVGSGRSGDLVAETLLAHTHGEALVSSEAGLSHSHSMVHTHQVTAKNIDPALNVVGTIDLRHTHTLDLGEHTHPLPSLDHSHPQSNMGKSNGSAWGEGNAQRNGNDHSDIQTGGANPATGKSVGVPTEAFAKGVKTTSQLDEPAKNFIGTATGQVPLHQTEASSASTTGLATPSSHSHTFDIPEVGEAGNEVDHVVLYAYIYAGKAW